MLIYANYAKDKHNTNLSSTPFCTNSIDLVDKHNGRCVLLCHSKHFSYQFGTISLQTTTTIRLGSTRNDCMSELSCYGITLQ